MGPKSIVGLAGALIVSWGYCRARFIFRETHRGVQIAFW